MRPPPFKTRRTGYPCYQHPAAAGSVGRIVTGARPVSPTQASLARKGKMGAADFSPRMAERLEANKVATVRSALVPGLIPRDFSSPSQFNKPSTIPSGSRAAANASRQSAASRRTASAVGCVKFSRDVRVRHRGEKRQIDGERRPAGFALPLAGRRQRRQAERENVLISRDVLPRDAIPIRRLRHGLAQRRGGGGVHVMPRRASEAARIGGGDGGEDVLQRPPGRDDRAPSPAQGAKLCRGLPPQLRAARTEE